MCVYVRAHDAVYLPLRDRYTHTCVAAAAKGVSETFATHSLHLDDLEENKSMYKSFDA